MGTGTASERTSAPHIPHELTLLPQWVGWWAVLGEGKQVKLPNGKLSPQVLKKQDKPHKLPINPRTGGLADTTNSSTWGKFRQAVDAKRRFGLTGVGFVFTEDDPYVGVDIDNCRDPTTGEIEPWAREIIRELNSYTEVSPFKHGVKIWIRAAKIPKGGGNQAKYETGKVEMFSRARYFAYTGVHVDETPLTIEDRQAEFLVLRARIFGRRNGHSTANAQPKTRDFSIDDQELLRRARQAKNGAQFKLLWDGKWKEAAYPSQSEADLALCCILAFWTDRDPTRMDRLFRSSGLMREKWDRDDYHVRTIDRAIERTPDTYRPRTESGPAAKVQATAPAPSIAGRPVPIGPKPTSVAELLPAVPNGFRLDESGVWKIRHEEHNEKPQWICSKLEVLTHTRSAENEDWGKLLRFEDPDGVVHEWVLPMSMLARDGAEFRAKLLSLGLRISSAQSAPNDLRQYILMAGPSASARTVERIGWYKNAGANAFVLPDGPIGPTNGEKILLQPAHEQSHLFRTAGSVEDWRKEVAYYCQENSLLVFAVSCAFAGPLLPFTGEQGGGFHLVATTTVGKTTTLMVGGSVWGGGGQNGFLQSWLTTSNGLENTAEWHNHCLLCLDELKLIKPEDASNIAYSLANGQRKTRQNEKGHSQRKAEWQLLFLSTGELSLQAHLEGVDHRFFGGQAVRFCEIPAVVNDKWGAFEQLHGFASPKKFSKHLRDQTIKMCYGTAGRAFLRKLTEFDYDKITAVVNELVSEWMRRYVPEGLSPEVVRGADRFALVAAAGELATQLGVTGWIKGTAAGSVAKCFDAWRRNRGTGGELDEQGALAVIRASLMAHGNSRFQPFEVGTMEKNDANYSVHNRLGYKSRGANSTIEYLLKKEALAEMCKPYPVDYAINTLRKNKLFVIEEEGVCTVRRKPPEMPRSRFYAISSRIFEDEQPVLEFEEKQVSQVSQLPGAASIN